LESAYSSSSCHFFLKVTGDENGLKETQKWYKLLQKERT
jgi:hypothetical protein